MKNVQLAVDLGTTNTVIAQWNEDIESPEIIKIDGICRGSDNGGEIDDSYTIPSSVYLLKPEEYLGFPGKLFYRNFKKKTGGLIGREAIERDGGLYSPRYINYFKPYLGKNSYQIIGKLGRWSYTSEDAARVFLKALFFNAAHKLNSPIGNVTFCTPVDYYEFYRAKIGRVCSSINIESIRTVDEPVAAALGYGLGTDDSKNILVVDFGAGTLNMALIRMGEKSGISGTCNVISKDGLPMGGNIVDQWIVEFACRKLGYDYSKISTDPDIKWWYRILLGEACRIKESLFFKDEDTFYLMPSGILNKYKFKIPYRSNEEKKPLDITRDEFVNILHERGLYDLTGNLMESVINFAVSKGISENSVDDVVMVGGSTLLPKFYSTVEKRFGRDRVRAWQPFNAVAFGAAAFASGKINRTDYITHDYAFITYNRKTHEPEYNIIIPKGTEYPTEPDFWKRQLSPTCALGEPERIFKLLICEIGIKHGYGQEFIWDDKGELYSLQEDDFKKQLIIPLNESNPVLGYLTPAHNPSDKGARLEISFMVNENKWLCSTVYDLKTHKYLMKEKPVIRIS